MITFESTGDFKNTDRFLKRMSDNVARSALRSAAQRGVNALAGATPVDSGLTGSSWGYEIRITKGTSTLTWTNSHSVNGVNIAIILQLGHGTGTGGWVAGRDYINPAIQPIFDQIAEDVWKVVTTA
jgi:hypothetical protein